MARSTLTTTIQRIQALADQVKGLPPEEYHYFLDLIDPQPEEIPTKKKRAKRGTGKSKRAPGIAEAIKNSLQAGQEANSNGADDSEETGPKCGVCGNDKDYQDHFKPSPNYHEFDGPKSVARAPRKSRQKSESIPSTVNIEGEMESVLAASSAGD